MSSSSPIIIFDLNRTLYDPETDALLEDALDVLQTCLDRGYRLALVSHNEKARADIIDAFGLRRFFNIVSLVEEKNASVFVDILAQMMAPITQSFAIGDVARKEIAIGKALGMQTIWLRAGKFKDVLPASIQEQPTYTAEKLWDVLAYLPPVDVA
jgi:FMN phosphatase YigB (HAD superfamily)